MEETLDVAEATAYCRDRAQTYRLFASIVDRELKPETAALVASLAEGMDGEAHGAAERDVVEGFKGMAAFAGDFDRDAENDLACDFARIFLAAGIYEGQAAVPYESVYTSEDHLLMQDARDEVRELYRRADVMPDTDGGIPEDYLTFELEFVALLTERSADALEAGDVDLALDWARRAHAFLENHIANWVGDMLDDVEEVAQLSFYRSFARALRGFVACEREDARSLVEALDAQRAAA